MNWRGKDRLLAISTPPPKMKKKKYIYSFGVLGGASRIWDCS